MGTIRIAKRNKFTVLPNVIMNDDKLSLRAKGLLCVLLSKPDDWRVDGRMIANEVKEGRDAVYTALTELETAGYLTRRKMQDQATKQWTSESTIYETPQEPSPGNPDPGEPDSGNQDIIEVKKQRTVSKEGSKEPSGEKAPRARNLLWDAWVEGLEWNPQTPQEQTRLGKVIREVKAFGGTPEQILTVCQNYKTKWPNAERTLEACMKHWTTMLNFKGSSTATVNPDEIDWEATVREHEAEEARRAANPPTQPKITWTEVDASGKVLSTTSL